MIFVVVVVVDWFLVRCRGVGRMVVEYILSCWVSEEARVSRILSLPGDPEDSRGLTLYILGYTWRHMDYV